MDNNKINNDNSDYYLGLDLSTQSLKLSIIDNNLQQVYFDKINFQDIINNNEQIIKTSIENGQQQSEQDILIFLKSIWKGLNNLKTNFNKIIKGISVSGQQHGSVYYKQNINYQNNKDFLSNLENIFSTNYCPIWMDSSTTQQCKEIQNKFNYIHSRTGSKPFERFTYPQILKKYQEQKDIYNQTIHISLISSFVAEILLGKFISIDQGDASGMNLMDLQTKKYIPEMINYIDGLYDKLGQYQPIQSWKSVGQINNYFIEQFNNIFNQNTIVIASTGDNLASMVGIGLLHSNNIAAISLGTSDTLFGIINSDDIETMLNPNIHIFASPLSDNHNGGIMREEILSKYKLTWQEVEDYYFKQYKPRGYYGCFLSQPEIVPQINSINPIEEIKNINKNIDINNLPVVEKVILLLEYKLISLKINYGIKSNSLDKLILTGGGCKNKIIQSLAANIFNCDILIQESEDSAAFGSALRAYHGVLTHNNNQDHTIHLKHLQNPMIYKLQLVCSPQDNINSLYNEIIPYVQSLEQNLASLYPY